MLLKNPVKTESTFNKFFFKSYLLFCSIVSLIILTTFLLKDFSNNDLDAIQNYLLPILGWFYLSIAIYSIFSLLYFRIIAPKWIFSHADKKFYADVFVFILIILSYIPSGILVYSYIFSSFSNIFIYGSYFAIFFQIPNFLAGVLANLLNGEFLVSLMIFSFALTRLFSPIFLFFSYPSRKTNQSKEKDISVTS